MSTDARALRSAKRSRVAADAEEATKDISVAKSATNLVECDSTSQPLVEVKTEEEKEPVYLLNGDEEPVRMVKLEDFQRACRMLEEAQARVDFLENLLDKKPALEDGELCEVDELQARLNNVCLTQQLAAERSRANLNDERVISLTRQLETEKSRIIEERKRTCARMEELNRELSKEVRKNRGEKMMDRASIRALKEQLEAVDKSRRIYLERIDELTRKLAQYDKRAPRAKKLPPKTLPDPNPCPPQLATIGKNRAFSEQTVNILWLCNPAKTKTIAYDSAVKQLKVFGDFHDTDRLKAFEKVFKLKKLNCLSCRRRLQPRNILDHFFSVGHAAKVRANKSEVSLHAFEYWLRNLRKVSSYKVKTRVAPVKSGSGPGVAGSAQVDGASGEIDFVASIEEGEIDN